jgi:hypothetical protein
MTRIERLAQTEARAKARVQAQRQRLAKVQSAQRAEERTQLAKRRKLVGTMVEDAGLFVLDDATLAGLMQRLAPLVQMPNPVAVLESLLMDAGCLDAGVTNGRAEADASCGPYGVSWSRAH